MSTKPLGFISRDEVGVTVAPITSPVFATNISTPAIIASGSVGITPASGSNLNVNLAGAGDFAVNTSHLCVDTSAGNVGIGTTAPGAKLEVNGDIFLSGNPGSSRYCMINETNTGTTQLNIQAGAGSEGFGGALSLFGHSHATKPGWVQVGMSAGSGGKFTVNALALGGGTDLFTVLQSGNVGIGTTDQFGAGVGVIGLANATSVPSSNPSGGIVVYADAADGKLKYRSASGEVRTVSYTI